LTHPLFFSPSLPLRSPPSFPTRRSSDLFGLRFVGSEGTMMVTMNDLTVARQPREKEPGYTIDTFSAAQQKAVLAAYREHRLLLRDRKSTRLNSSHVAISYAVFCLKKKKN